MTHAESSNHSSSNDVRAAGAGERSAMRKGKRRSDPPATLEQLLRLAYERKGRPISLPAKQQKFVAQNLDITSEFRETLHLLASQDTLFAVPRELLLLSSDTKMNVKLRGALQAFVRDALLGHPFLVDHELQNSIRNTDDGLEPSAAVLTVMRLELRSVRDEALKKLNPKAFARLRLNVAHALALSIAQMRSLDNQAFANVLYEAIWKEAGDKIRSEAKRSRILTDPAQLRGMATSSGVFQSAAEAASQRANELGDRVSRMAQSLTESQGASAALRQQLVDLEQRRAREQSTLEKQLSELSTRADDQAMHLRHEREVLRARLLRALKSDLDLLQSGLDAAHRPMPKHEVLIDAVERVTDSMRQQLRQLEGG